jgi:hypothetical protein
MDHSSNPAEPSGWRRRNHGFRGVGIASASPAAGRQTVPQAGFGERLGLADRGVRRSDGGLCGSLPLLPGRARLVWTSLHLGTHADARADDRLLRPRPTTDGPDRNSSDDGDRDILGGVGLALMAIFVSV